MADRQYSRRDFLRMAGMATAVAAVGCQRITQGPSATPTAPVATPTVKLSGDLRILQWSHFVPRHDMWFDAFARTWGQQVGVNVTVDHIDQAEIAGRLTAEIQGNEGHDLVELIFPPAAFEPSVLDLSDVNKEAQKRHGKQIASCTRSSYNPTTDRFYGFCHGWAPDPGDYRKSLWEKAGLPNGPSTYQELLDGGTKVKTEQGIQMGIGMSNEIDSNMAARALIWSYGGSIQDDRENVVFNSDQTVAAVEYMVKLFKQTMTDEVFGWNAASNNQGLVAGRLSYILNSISAYRSAQKSRPDVADDVFFTSPLKGPGGKALAAQHAVPVYVVPEYAKNPDAAREFILHLVANYTEATDNTELYTFPSFPSTVPKLDMWLGGDPYGSKPGDKLALLKEAEKWTVNVGYPGPANAAEGEVFGTFVLPQMMAKAAKGDLSAKDAVAEADAKIKAVFKNWRDRKLVGGRA